MQTRRESIKTELKGKPKKIYSRVFSRVFSSEIPSCGGEIIGYWTTKERFKFYIVKRIGNDFWIMNIVSLSSEKIVSPRFETSSMIGGKGVTVSILRSYFIENHKVITSRLMICNKTYQ